MNAPQFRKLIVSGAVVVGVVLGGPRASAGAEVKSKTFTGEKCEQILLDVATGVGKYTSVQMQPDGMTCTVA